MVERNADRLGGKFIGIGDVIEGQVITACLDLGFESFDDYEKACRKISKGNAIRDAKKADKAGYYVKPFDRRMHIPDIVEINTSKEVRSGGKMKASYRRSIDEMGGAPSKHFETEMPSCPVHYDLWWGIFEKVDGYKQGDVVTNERLLAYIDLRRLGDYGLYSMIIGHGDYLKDGVVNRLHLGVMEWLLEAGNACGEGFKSLMYAGYYQGGDGLRRWKKRFAFEPTYLVASDAKTTSPVLPLRRLFRAMLAKLTKGGK
ncbi:MAG: hypothetical protein R3217_03755 [Gammaproteobacteria bacterium]|nr:hypothetical protein [Gammaproteobacteria bacterium]